jgi:hypothetical protein
MLVLELEQQQQWLEQLVVVQAEGVDGAKEKDREG